ncbi:MAG: dihydropteroate synthase [Flavobacteriales bacterium]|nr:dihydropteroate synthase [Flavobacteriales bacterium]
MNAFNIKGKILDLSTAKVMGILNITNDSFYDGGKYLTEKNILQKTHQMLNEGAAIIDIGAQSSRPGAKPINFEIEKERLVSTTKLLKRNFPSIIISIDTCNAEIAKICIENSADIINDISAGEMDRNMFEVVANYNVPYIMMHMQGTPENMQKNPQYQDISKELFLFFQQKIKALKILGHQKIIIDPGFGFGKNLHHNYELLNNLQLLKKLGFPILAGISRKSMIYSLLDTIAENALSGTTAVNTIALQNGASILRVHDVKQAVECIKIVNFAKSCEK